ncbi:hypothetical protein, partial [uncultured Oscillibacter sp.]|uniref:hypothetical protein n=1 Tax=uncultured Oscillibacter sp. TaxID=876091 RepID=UPI00263518DF
GSFLELLGGFEPPTSSLPTDCRPWEYRFPVLSGHFCCRGSWSLTLFRPLIPSGHFAVWVTVWVRSTVQKLVRNTPGDRKPSKTLVQLPKSAVRKL